MDKYWLLMPRSQRQDIGEDFSSRSDWQTAPEEMETRREKGWGKRVVQWLAQWFAPTELLPERTAQQAE